MSERKQLSIAPNVPVFDLPILVALELGLFEKHGIEARLEEDYRADDASSEDAFQRQKERLYESNRANAYNLCEWAGLDRSQRSQRGSRVHALRPAVVAQVILSFDDDLQELRDLAGVPIGINQLTGSHYTLLQFLDGALPREEIVVLHAGEPAARYEDLKAGRIRAAALMEPYVSLALKEGAHIIGVNFYRGSEVISPDLSDSTRSAYLAAINEASDLINQDFNRYRHYIVEPVKDRLSPEELDSRFVRYAHSRAMDPARFDYTYQWMQSWDLSDGGADYRSLVLN